MLAQRAGQACRIPPRFGILSPLLSCPGAWVPRCGDILMQSPTQESERVAMMRLPVLTAAVPAWLARCAAGIEEEPSERKDSWGLTFKLPWLNNNNKKDKKK